MVRLLLLLLLLLSCFRCCLQNMASVAAAADHPAAVVPLPCVCSQGSLLHFAHSTVSAPTAPLTNAAVVRAMGKLQLLQRAAAAASLHGCCFHCHYGCCYCCSYCHCSLCCLCCGSISSPPALSSITPSAQAQQNLNVMHATHHKAIGHRLAETAAHTECLDGSMLQELQCALLIPCYIRLIDLHADQVHVFVWRAICNDLQQGAESASQSLG